MPHDQITLDNGLSITTKLQNSSELTAVNIKVFAGLITEKDYAGSGISHFIEHLIFRPDASNSNLSLQEKIKSIGGSVNANTGLDATTYYAVIPNDHTEEAIGFFYESLHSSRFDRKFFQKERSVILKEISMRSDEPDTRLIELLFRHAYTRHPYKHPIIGYEERFKKLTVDDISQYHAAYYVPNNMVISIAGGFNKDKVIKKIDDTFGRTPRGKAVIVSDFFSNENIFNASYAENADVNLARFAISYKGTSLSQNDSLALDILSMLLAGSKSSVLYEELVQKSKLLYSIDSINYTPYENGLFILYGIGYPEKIVQAMDKIDDYIEYIKSDNFDKSDIEKAITMTTVSYLDASQTVRTQADFLSTGQLLLGNPDYPNEYIKQLNSIKPEDVKKAADKYLVKKRRATVLLSPLVDKETQIPSSGHGYSIAPRLNELPNGMRIITTYKNSNDIVGISIYFLGGLLAENENNNGISALISKLLLSGTKNKTESQISLFFDQIGATIACESGMNTLGFNITCMKKDIYACLSMLSELLTGSTFSQKNIEKAKEELYSEIDISRDEIFQHSYLELKKYFFGNHPYAMNPLGRKESIKTISRKDILNFYHNRVLQPKKGVLSMCGPFESDTITQWCEDLFDRIPVPYETIAYGNNDADYLSGRKAITMPKKQSVIMIAYPGAIIKSEDRIRLKLISAILSGSDGILFKKLRDKVGISYAQGAFELSGLSAGMFTAYVATDKKNVKKAEQIIKDAIRSLLSGFSEKELKEAKKSLIGDYLRMLEKKQGISSISCLDELYSLGYTHFLEFKENIELCSKSDIIKTAKKYLSESESLTLFVLPENE